MRPDRHGRAPRDGVAHSGDRRLGSRADGGVVVVVLRGMMGEVRMRMRGDRRGGRIRESGDGGHAHHALPFRRPGCWGDGRGGDRSRLYRWGGPRGDGSSRLYELAVPKSNLMHLHLPHSGFLFALFIEDYRGENIKTTIAVSCDKLLQFGDRKLVVHVFRRHVRLVVPPPLLRAFGPTERHLEIVRLPLLEHRRIRGCSFALRSGAMAGRHGGGSQRSVRHSQNFW